MHKSIDREGIMLGRDAEFPLDLALLILLGEHLILAVQRARAVQELLTVCRRCDATAVPIKNFYAKLTLQFLQGRRQRRLRHVKLFGRLVERTETGDRQYISDLLKCQSVLLLPFASI